MPSWSKIARRIRVPLGFLFAAVYVWLAHPTVLSMIIAAVFVICGLLIRAAASGHVKKNEELTTSGPYAYTRNPLYLGSMLIAAGFAVALLSWMFGLVLAAGFLVIYVPVIASEERFLRATFPQFADYCRRVPRILPRFRPPPGPDREESGRFSLGLYLKHREYNALLGVLLLYLSLAFLRPAITFILHGRP